MLAVRRSSSASIATFVTSSTCTCTCCRYITSITLTTATLVPAQAALVHFVVGMNVAPKADLRHVSTPASDTAKQAANPAVYPTKLYPEIEPFDSGMLEVGSGHSLYYEQCGNPNGVPCVFLHGGPGAGCDERSRRFFDPEFYRIVVFDQRGSGRSSPNAADDLTASLVDNTTPDLVADIERLRTKLNIDKWGLVLGGSWGSTLALAYAQAHPANCRALLLRGVFLFGPDEVDYLFCGGGTFGQNPAAWEAYVEYIRSTSDDWEREKTNLLGACALRRHHPLRRLRYLRLRRSRRHHHLHLHPRRRRRRRRHRCRRVQRASSGPADSHLLSTKTAGSHRPLAHSSLLSPRTPGADWARLTSDDAATRSEAAAAFVGYELSISKTYIDPAVIEKYLGTPSILIPFAVMEVHYSTLPRLERAGRAAPRPQLLLTRPGPSMSGQCATRASWSAASCSTASARWQRTATPSPLRTAAPTMCASRRPRGASRARCARRAQRTCSSSSSLGRAIATRSRGLWTRWCAPATA